MGIVKCRECSKDVSDEAKICPHCGIKKPAPPTKFGHYAKIALGVIIVFGMVRCISNAEDEKALIANETRKAEALKTPEQRSREAIQKKKKEADFQSVLKRLTALKASSKNPDSFVLEEALLMEDGTLCATYRGTNSFNAVVIDRTAIDKNLRAVDWKRFCAGKSGQDMNYVRAGL